MNYIVCAALACLIAGPAVATSFTYTFTAALDRRTGSDAAVTIVDQVEAFSTLTGTLTFDDTFVSATSDSATYGTPILTLNEVSLAGVLTPVNVRVDNDAFGGAFDQVVGVNTPLPQDGVYRDIVNVLIRDTTATALSSTAFPTDLTLADFNIPILFFTSSSDDGTNASARERIDYRFTSLSLAPVPLPAGLPLLLGGVAGLAWLRARRRT